ncbi:LysR family transcriptional regulator [Advenella kashmirensis WT001]|uniref:LysR family transcriptional regulator n=1 Tax=Advenella kashmirensis (strain DSM 17095 / LMG 22695 / WT001) TaxID=1036672 RepID=I3UHW4_ADVKW|nr:LysR substrate-binding domain-containing protein [Advenella kashmirensis]AFK64602.1 LysR family transcriptional regulator [Advenella kashmirensis WT001]
MEQAGSVKWPCRAPDGFIKVARLAAAVLLHGFSLFTYMATDALIPIKPDFREFDLWSIDPTSLYLFIAVCETGSIARAGERELLSAAAVSKRMVEIERKIGAPLLLRSQRGVTPTSAGQVLLKHARSIMVDYRKLQSELSEHALGVKGHVRLLSNVSAIMEFLPADLTSFLEAHPNIQVDLEEHFSSDIPRKIEEGNADIGICRDFVPTGNTCVTPYRYDHFAIVVNKAHPLAGKKSLMFEQTLDYPQIGFSMQTSMNTLMSHIAGRQGKTLTYRTHVSSFDAAYRLIEANLGIAALPREAVERYVRLYDLELIPLDDPWARRNFVLCTRANEALSGSAQKLFDHLQAQAGSNLPG